MEQTESMKPSFCLVTPDVYTPTGLDLENENVQETLLPLSTVIRSKTLSGRLKP